jgi:NADPH2:quinone reductase
MTSITARMAQIDQYGGPEMIHWVEDVLPAPAPDEVRIRTTAVGLNFIDTYHRRGIYPFPLPMGLGVEGAGVIEQVGSAVTGFAPGDRVATLGPAMGAYATHRNLPAAQLFHVPDDIDDETVAAIMLKGCTAEFLVERCGKVEAGWPVLVHAAAGGVGQLLVQWLKAVGAIVIGAVGHPDKAAIATRAGADHVIVTDSEDLATRVRDITGGAGVRVVFDGVGMATWEASLAATARCGLIISYGNASAPVTGVALGQLAAHGSLFVTRPTLYDYYGAPAERQAGSARLFDMLRSGKLSVTIGQRYPLEAVAQAHRDLEARRTTGSTLLLP